MLSQQNKIAKSNLDALTKDEKSLKEAAAKKAIESGVEALTKKVLGAAASKALGGIGGDIVVNPPAMPSNNDCAAGAKPPYCVVSAKPIATPTTVKSQAPVTKSTSIATKPSSAVAAKPSASTTKVMASLAKAAPATPKLQAPIAKPSKPQQPVLTKKTIVPAKPSGAILLPRPLIRRTVIKQQPAIPPQKRVTLKKPIVRAKPLRPVATTSKPAKSAHHHASSVSTESRYNAVTDRHGNVVTTGGGGIVVTNSSRDYYDNNRWSGHDCGRDSDRSGGYGTGGGFSGSGGDSPGYGGKGCR